MTSLDLVSPSDYGVHVEHLGNILDVLVRRPFGDDRFTLSMPDALDLRDAITAWERARLGSVNQADHSGTSDASDTGDAGQNTTPDRSD